MSKGKLKSMNLKEKIEYIWEYYKAVIIAIIGIVFLVTWLTYEQFNKVNYIFNMTFLSSGLKESEMYKLQAEITKVVVESGNKKEVVQISTVPINFEKEKDPYVNIQVVQRFTNQVAGSEVDLIILDRRDLEGLVEEEILKEITDIDKLDIDKERLVQIGNNKEIYAINIEGNNILEAVNYNTENKVLGICKTSKRNEESIKVIQWLFD